MAKHGKQSISISLLLVALVGAVPVCCTVKQQDDERQPEVEQDELMLRDFPKRFEKDVLIVVGKSPRRVELECSGQIAAKLQELTGNKPRVRKASEVTENDKASCNLILIATPGSNELLQEVYTKTTVIRVTREYPGQNQGVVKILRNPWNKDKALLVLAGSDEAGLKAGSMMMDEIGESTESMATARWKPSPEEVPTRGVMAAPRQVFIHVGGKEELSFWNHKMAVNYISSFPQQVLKVVLDGREKVIKIDATSECPNDHCGYYWHQENLDFSVRPIVWKTDEDLKQTWSYGKTWNTDDLYFEVSVIRLL